MTLDDETQEIEDLEYFKKNIDFLEKIGTINELDWSEYLDLGNLYHGVGDLEKSIENLQKSLDMRPNSTEIMNKMAITFIDKKDYENAEKIFFKTLDIEPLNETTILLLYLLFKELTVI